MAKFIHTADWQIGKPFIYISEEQKRFYLRQERLNVINRIKDKVEDKKAEFLLVAGDLFDCTTPTISTVIEVLELIGKMNIPVLAIPGNHDHGALGTIWHSDEFKRYQSRLAPNFSLLIKEKPIEIDTATILPCPLLRNKTISDPTLWLKNIDWKDVSPTKPRIVIAHGGIQGFSGRDYLLNSSTDSMVANYINLKEMPLEEIDYIALGDWHNLKQVNSKTWYCGTPEPDRFDQGKNNQRGQILEVDISRGQTPLINIIQTGRLQWHNLKFRFNNDSDIDRFVDEIEKITNGRISKDLIRVEVSGEFSLSGYSKYELIRTELENKLLALRVKGHCHKAPKEEELEKLTKSTEDPLIAEVAVQLKEKMEKMEDPNQIKIARLALCELYKFATQVK